MAKIRIGKAAILSEMNLLCMIQDKILTVKSSVRESIQSIKFEDIIVKDVQAFKSYIEGLPFVINFSSHPL